MDSKVILTGFVAAIVFCVAPSFGQHYCDSFEEGIGNYWIETSEGTGVVEITSQLARTGASAVLTDQSNGYHMLRHDFPEGFQGSLSIYVYFPELAAEPAEWAAAFLLVTGPDGLSYSVEAIGADVTEGWTSGQAYGKGVSIDYDKLWKFGPGWHELKIEVDGSGTQGWFDGVALPHFHPCFTSCTALYIGIGWHARGAALWDNYCATPKSIAVEIDVKPGSYPNAVNLEANGVVPVAILSSETFNAIELDETTVELAGAGVAIRGKNHYLAEIEDVNSDGLPDLVCHVDTENLLPASFQDGYAQLTGETFDGVPIEGWDELVIVPPQ